MLNKKLSLRFFPSILWLFGVASLIIIIDQALKYKIRLNDGFYICNAGSSFGLPLYPVIFYLLFGVFLIMELVYVSFLIKKGSLTPSFILALALATGGALSNSVDRFYFGCVFDYIFPFWTFLPVFNVADIAIFLGGCLLIFLVLTKDTQYRV